MSLSKLAQPLASARPPLRSANLQPSSPSTACKSIHCDRSLYKYIKICEIYPSTASYSSISSESATSFRRPGPKSSKSKSQIQAQYDT